MNIGIIGTGNLGSLLGQLFVKNMHKVMFTARHPDRLHALTNAIGNNAFFGSLEDTLKFADVQILALPFGEIVTISKKASGLVNEKIIIDATRAYLVGKSATCKNGCPITNDQGYLSKLFPHSYLAKAFYSHNCHDIKIAAYADGDDKKTPMPFSCDHTEVKEIIENLISNLGFEPEFMSHPHPIAMVKEKLRTASSYY